MKERGLICKDDEVRAILDGRKTAHAALAARLDRERRQACRRAALYAWRMFSTIVRGSDHRPLVSLVFGADRNGVGKSTRYALASALHFRAEARRP